MASERSPAAKSATGERVGYYSIGALMLFTAVVAVILAAFLVYRPLGGLIAILLAPAWVVTADETSARAERHEVFGYHEQWAMFFHIALATFVLLVSPAVLMLTAVFLLFAP